MHISFAAKLGRILCKSSPGQLQLSCLSLLSSAGREMSSRVVYWWASPL